jgi:mono/diheme cytochrome c family protein
MRAWIWLCLVGCLPEGSVDLVDPGADDAATSAVDPGAQPAALTWHGSVRAIFEQRCVSCHEAGGAAPFPLTHDPAEWAEGVPRWAAASARSVAEATMPPWKPDPDCKPIVGERVLSDEEKATVAAWAAAGFPEGDPASYKPPPPPDGVPLEPADLQLRMPVPFVPDASSPDDYRCFVLDYDASVERWMTGFDVVPDQLAMVHHVILYQLDAEYADDVATWDAADAEPGYDCLFDPGTWDSMMMGGWAPGQQPIQYPAGVARHLPEGSKLVLQLHYNTANLPMGQAPAADRSGVEMWFMDEGASPERELVSFPFPVYPTIPAGDPAAVAEQTITFADYLWYVPEVLIDLFADQVAIIGYYPHMHQLGRRIRLDVVRDGTETCEISIDDWDFNWQQGYILEESAWYQPVTTDAIRLRCEYDNSPENQPVINGVQGEPRDVYWGEGSYDEMCLVFLETLLPPGLWSSL